MPKMARNITFLLLKRLQWVSEKSGKLGGSLDPEETKSKNSFSIFTKNNAAASNA